MLIGPLVRRLAAAAPGLTIQVLPRASDAVRLLRDGEADLVIEPVEIMPDNALASRRLFADRWVCCFWAGSTEVGDHMTMETYLRLGYLVYSAVRGHPVSIVDTYLAQAKMPRRIEFTVGSFLLAPFLSRILASSLISRGARAGRSSARSLRRVRARPARTAVVRTGSARRRSRSVAVEQARALGLLASSARRPWLAGRLRRA